MQRAARARARGRARADRLARARRLGLDDVRHRRPPQGRRRRGRRAGRSATWRRGAATGSACSPSAAASRAILRPRQGRLGLLGLLAELRARAGGRRRRRDLARHRAAQARRRSAAQRGLVVVVSDFRGERDWEGPLRTLRAPPRRARGRDPRPARAGARRRSATSGWSTRDRPPGARQHAPRRVRKRFARRPRRPSATRSPPRCAAPAPTTSCSPPTGDWLRTSPATCAAARPRCARTRAVAPMSFR